MIEDLPDRREFLRSFERTAGFAPEGGQIAGDPQLDRKVSPACQVDRESQRPQPERTVARRDQPRQDRPRLRGRKGRGLEEIEERDCDRSCAPSQERGER